MAEYQCTFCFDTKKADSVPDTCTSCGAKYSDWKNLSTNKIECVKNPGKFFIVSAEPKKSKPVKPSSSTKTVTKKPAPLYTPTITKTTPPPKRSPIGISRKAGLSLSRSIINVSVPMGRNSKETIFIRNLDVGIVSGTVTSDSYFVVPKPDSFSFHKFLFLDIIINTKRITAPMSRKVTIRIESSGGDYDIILNMKVVETKFFSGFKYIFKPWN